jgi:hypothetical protein
MSGPSLFKAGRYAYAGRVVAEETGRLLGKTGQIVVVSLDYRGQQAQLATETDGFLQAIKGQGITVAGKELEDPVAFANGQKMLTGDVYLALVQKYPSADAIVSFLGSPQLDQAQKDQLGTKIPKFVAFSIYTFAGKRLFQDGLIQVAILPRFEPLPPTAKEPKSDQEWFNRNFQIVHAEDASRLPK